MACTSQYIGILYPIGVTNVSGGGAASGGSRDYHFTIDKRIPNTGIRYASIGDIPTSSVPHVVRLQGTLVGATIAVNKIDPARGYAIDILVNGVLSESVPLSSGVIQATSSSFTTVINPGDNISILSRRTSGSGRSSFRNMVISLHTQDS